MVYNSDLTSDLRMRTGMDRRYRNSRHSRHVELCAKLLLVLIGHRVLRKLNSTGDKWAHLPDLARWLKEDDSKIGMTLLLLAGEFLNLTMRDLYTECFSSSNAIFIL